jgi:hypothetical protein
MREDSSKCQIEVPLRRIYSNTTLATTDHDYDLEHMAQGQTQLSGFQILVTTAESDRHLAQEGFQQSVGSYVRSREQVAQTYQQHSISAIAYSQMFVLDAAYEFEEACFMNMSGRVSHPGSAYSSPHDSLQTRTAYEQQLQQQQGSPCDSLPGNFAYDDPEMHQTPAQCLRNNDCVTVETTFCEPMRSRGRTYNLNSLSTHSAFRNPAVPAQDQHHHHVLNLPSLPTSHLTGHSNGTSTVGEFGLLSVVGQLACPSPLRGPEAPSSGSHWKMMLCWSS